MTTTAAVAPEIQLVDIGKLMPHPKNPREKLSAKDPKVLELKASIEKLGQKVPCLVRPKGDGYELVLGHRRTFVQELLGASTVPCVVEELSDELALAILLAEHATHAAPDPFLEGEAVATLLARPGWHLQAVSDHLGKSVRWCALRANLKNLSPKVRDYIKKNDLDWPLEWLEDLARLTPESQEALLKTDGVLYVDRLEHVHDRRSLDRLLGNAFHELGKATWKLDDATLVPKAGPCTTCPKTSLRAPGLFDDADADPADPADPKALKRAICRDAVCWRSKTDAVTKARILELKKEEPKAEVLTKGYDAHAPAGMKAKRLDYGTQEVKKGTKGAKPAVIIGEDGPKLAYVKERTYGAKPKADPAKKPDKDEDPKKALARSRKEIEGRRETLFVHKLAGVIQEREKPPAHEVVLGLVTAFSVDEDFEGEELEDTKKAFDLAAKLPAWDKAVWARVKGAIEQRLSALTVRRAGHTGEDLDAFIDWITAILDIDAEKLEAAVMKDIPDPKWWPKDANALQPGAKRPAHKLADVATPGMCRGCGCTHDRACEGGCSWVEQPDVDGLQKKDSQGRFQPLGLCSSCAGAQPKGKAKKKAKARA